MHYYKLLYDYEGAGDYVNCDIGHIGEMDEYMISVGKSISEWSDVVLEYDSNEGKILTDYLANLYRWLVVSSDFMKLSGNFIDSQVQYLPIRVVDRSRNFETNSYSAINITILIDAMNMDESDYDILKMDNEEILLVTKYVLNKYKLEGSHIFRIKNDTIPIFVSEMIREIVEDNGLTGFDFLEVDVI